MGACSSCLGRDRDPEHSNGDERAGLLNDDPHSNQYGTLDGQIAGIVQVDPQESARESDALQKVVTQTSNHLVDIFALVSRNSTPAPSSTLPAHDARFLRYQTVLAKMSAHDQSSRSTHQHLNENTLSASEGWASGDDEIEETKSCKPVKSEGIGSILGGFADADSVMD